MEIRQDNILFSSEDRARQDYGDVREMVESLGHNGQLQPILVRRVDEENPDHLDEKAIEEDKDYVLLDGGRRYVAVQICHKKDLGVAGLSDDHIEAKVLDNVPPKQALIFEFRANEDRKNFDWREKARLIRAVHEAHVEEEDMWSGQQTAELLGLTKNTVSKYLRLTKSEEVFDHPKIEGADTFRTAWKQFEIVMEEKRRERTKQHRNKLEDLRESGDVAPVSEDDIGALAEGAAFETDSGSSDGAGETQETAGDEAPAESQDDDSSVDIPVVTHDDCRHWLAQIPDEYFDWVHWDPPYGGEQGGGAFSQYTQIADDWMTASTIMRETIPEIFRVLKDGDWLAIWCHPARVAWVSTYLRGHVPDENRQTCRHCGRRWLPMEGELDEVCMANPDWRFWVNPYPNIWYKRDRVSDGHEIRRFGVNQYETFLFACKQDEHDNPILPEQDWSNVFGHAMPTSDERRHVMHKPAGLLEKIIEIISVEDSLGCDPSAGSGSVIEAALKTGRSIRVCEAEEEYAKVCHETAKTTVREIAEEMAAV